MTASKAMTIRYPPPQQCLYSFTKTNHEKLAQSLHASILNWQQRGSNPDHWILRYNHFSRSFVMMLYAAYLSAVVGRPVGEYVVFSAKLIHRNSREAIAGASRTAAHAKQTYVPANRHADATIFNVGQIVASVGREPS